MSITVAQRAREFALIRMVGRQAAADPARSVILEAIVIGLIASVIGLLVGLAFAAGLNAVFSRSARTCPTAARSSRPARSSWRSSSVSA